MLPMYIYYSMFGFQRVGDPIWAAADSRTRGFLLGATAGRTTLSGEGLQHQDGSSHLVASTVPNCRAYDPCYAYELAVILEDGMRRMLAEQCDDFFYVTVMNENYAQPSAPGTGATTVAASAPDGEPAAEARMGFCAACTACAAHSRPRACALLGAGTILRETLAAAELLESEFGLGIDVYSVTSFTELRREAMALTRAQRLGAARGALLDRAPAAGRRDAGHCGVRLRQRGCRSDPAMDPRSLSRARHRRLRSIDTRAALRAFFEVDRRSIALAALAQIDPALAQRARTLCGIAPSAPPWTR